MAASPENTIKKVPGAQDVIFVDKILQLKDRAILIWFSNGSVQVNFQESCVLIKEYEEPKRAPFVVKSMNKDLNSFEILDVDEGQLINIALFN